MVVSGGQGRRRWGIHFVTCAHAASCLFFLTEQNWPLYSLFLGAFIRVANSQMFIYVIWKLMVSPSFLNEEMSCSNGWFGVLFPKPTRDFFLMNVLVFDVYFPGCNWWEVFLSTTTNKRFSWKSEMNTTTHVFRKKIWTVSTFPGELAMFGVAMAFQPLSLLHPIGMPSAPTAVLCPCGRIGLRVFRRSDPVLPKAHYLEGLPNICLRKGTDQTKMGSWKLKNIFSEDKIPHRETP